MTEHGHGYARAHAITGEYWLDLRPGDLHWNLSDPGWAKAAWGSLFAPWCRGAAIFAYHFPQFDPVEAPALLRGYPISTLCATPTAHRLFVRAGLAGHTKTRMAACGEHGGRSG